MCAWKGVEGGVACGGRTGEDRDYTFFKILYQRELLLLESHVVSLEYLV